MPEGPTPKQSRIGARTCILSGAIFGALLHWVIGGDRNQAVAYAAGGVVLVLIITAISAVRRRRGPTPDQGT